MDRTQRPFLERLPLLGDQPAVAYGLALLLSLIAWWLRAVLDPVFPPGFPYLTFFPAVIVSSFLFGRSVGTVAAVICGVIAWYFFIPPVNDFRLMRGTTVALLFYAGVVAVDIALVHWMQGANRRLRDERERSRQLAEHSAQLAERTELLFHELQHRVSNNLQMVGAVLGLQKRGITDPAARQAMDEAAVKLQLIGRIQRQLYGTAGEQIALDVFLGQLAADLTAASGKPGVTYAIKAEQHIRLDPDALIPVALIMAEAIANALEHGFADREGGHIAIELARRADRVELSVTDNGVGLPAGFDLNRATSLGLKIARTLAQQLDGQFDMRPAMPGVVASLSFPAVVRR